MMPECVQQRNKVWFWFAREISITTGVGIRRSRSRRADPRAQASLVVKRSNIKEASMRDMDSSWGVSVKIR